jgi:adenylosuccinate lyase
MKAWRGEGAFGALLAADERVGGKLSTSELDALFDPAWSFAHVDTIFERVFGPE